jgi:hypothetical protein
MSQPPLLTVFIFRRSYGRRYTELPIDRIDHDSFAIDCSGSVMRPDLYDLLVGDVVRWREGERFIEAVIDAVRRDGQLLTVALRDSQPLPPDYFPY